MKIYFVGAGPGAQDLITLRGRELLGRADVIVYAGSLVNPALLEYAKAGCEIHDSASMTLEEVIEVLAAAALRGDLAVRLHTGDPSLYGAIREQMDALRARGHDFAVVPGVSSFSAAAAALCAEYTLPGVSQSLIVTRAAGRTSVPEGESLASFAAHSASMVLFLSSGMIGRACGDLIAGGYDPATPAAIVYKASWPDERALRGTLATIAEDAQCAGIEKTALILVGDFLGNDYERSKLYDPAFSHGFREASNCSDKREVQEAQPPGGCGQSPRPNSPRKETNAPIFAAFTDVGVHTALKLQGKLGGSVFAPARFTKGQTGVEPMDAPLGEWTARHFHSAKALVFVSAAGIAVRAIAPLLVDKTSDPAVVCLDDLGCNVVSILSGHLGGANELTSRIAAITGGNAVITTATDLRGIEAVDSWARGQGMAVENPEAIRAVSGAMLAGEQVGVAITEENVSPPWPVTLRLRPKNLVLGVGSKKGITGADLDEAIADFLAGAGVSPLSLAAVASIDLKKDEPAIVAWCASRKLAYRTYAAAELDEAKSAGGGFSASERVRAVTGTDNVCERAAVLAAQSLAEGGLVTLMRSKTIYPGITLALAKFHKRSDKTEKSHATSK